MPKGRGISSEALMILLDSSEAITNPPDIDCHIVPWLEKLTGADAMISPANDIAAVEGMLDVHICRGALLIQIKRSQDLISSFGDRLNSSIAKMVTIAPKQWQRILLPVGRYACDKNELLMIGKEIERDDDQREYPFIRWYKPHPSVHWKSYQTAIVEWIWRGGVVVETCKNQRDFWLWIKNTEQKMMQAMKEEKLSWPGNPQMYDPPDKDDPLQDVKLVRDFRVTLATIPGIGISRANDIWEFYEHDPMACLVGLTDVNKPNATNISGIGISTIQRVREWLQLHTWANLGIDVDYDTND